MAFGKSIQLRWTTRTKPMEPLPPGPSRDRTLRGKARIKARKEANKVRRST